MHEKYMYIHTIPNPGTRRTTVVRNFEMVGVMTQATQFCARKEAFTTFTDKVCSHVDVNERLTLTTQEARRIKVALTSLNPPITIYLTISYHGAICINVY